jgi:hypothetical protein
MAANLRPFAGLFMSKFGLAACGVLVVVAVGVGVALALGLTGDDRPSEDGGDLVTVGLVPTGAFSAHWASTLDLRPVSSVDEAQRLIDAGVVWAIALDHQHLNDVPSAQLASWVKAGLTIIGLDITQTAMIERVRAAGGLDDYEAQLPPGAPSAFDLRAAASGARDEDERFFSYLVRTPATVLAATGCARAGGGVRMMSETLSINVEGLRLTGGYADASSYSDSHVCR